RADLLLALGELFHLAVEGFVIREPRRPEAEVVLFAVPAIDRQPAALTPPQLRPEIPLGSTEEPHPPAARAVHALAVGLAARTRDELPEADVHAGQPDGGTGRSTTVPCVLGRPV